MKSSTSRKKSTHAGSKSSKAGAVKVQSWWLIAALVLAAIAAGVFLLTRPAENASAGLPAEISVAEGFERFENGAFLLDVRTPEEWNEYHVDGSTLIPLDQLAQRVNEVPKDREVVVVCRSGNRSQQGRDILRAAGFAQVTSMGGGLSQWRSAGYPTVSGP